MKLFYNVFGNISIFDRELAAVLGITLSSRCRRSPFWIQISKVIFDSISSYLDMIRFVQTRLKLYRQDQTCTDKTRLAQTRLDF